MDMPNIGMGTFRLKDEVAYQSVLTALELGYRHIDTAQIYGNETQVGQALADSGIAREQVFLITKIWRDNLDKNNFMNSLRTSLDQLQTEYVDLLLIHWPVDSTALSLEQSLTELKYAQELGVAKRIGVSNFTIAQLERAIRLLGAQSIFTNQIEVHPYLQNIKLRHFMQTQGIRTTAYMPLAVGKVLQEPELVTMAQKYQITVPQLVLAWVIQQGMDTIPMSTKRQNLLSNLQTPALNLTAADLAVFTSLEQGLRLANPSFAPLWD
jgi:diketogulonate reductase-like aldo/keto reductase